MSVKLFILGRPGSGKSTAYRHIKGYLERHYKGWSVERYNDYDFLQSMFLYEKLYNTPQRQFTESAFGGFDVVDFDVLETVLKRIEKKAQERLTDKKDEFVIVEFARQNYEQALRTFSYPFLRDAYYLFIEADVDICLQRVKQRVTDPLTTDNHFVSEGILKGYYGKEILPAVGRTFQYPTRPLVESYVSSRGKHLVSLQSTPQCYRTLALNKKQTRVISSHGSLQSFNKKVDSFIDSIFKQLDRLDEKVIVAGNNSKNNGRAVPAFIKKAVSGKERSIATAYS